MDIHSAGCRSRVQEHPYLKANFLSRITYFYMKDVINKYFCTSFTENDLYETLPNLSSQLLGNKLETIWKRNLKKGKSSVLRMLLSYFGKEFWSYSTVFILMRLLRTFLQPILIGIILVHFSPNRSNDTFKYALAASIGLMLFYVLANLLNQYYFFVIHRQGLQIAIGLSSLIYRKALRLKISSKNFFLSTNEDSGNIVTLITKDVLIFDNTNNYIAELIYFVINFLMTTFLICRRLGVVGFTTTLVILTMLLLQLFFSKKIYNKRIEVAFLTAARLEIIREVLSAIKVIKMYTWESFFIKKINNARKKEMKGIFILYLLKFFTFTIGSICASSNFYILFIAYISINQNISTDTLFYIILLLDNLKYYITTTIPIGLTAVGEMLSAVKRIEQFLLLDEITKVHQIESMKPKIEIENATIKMSSHSVQVSLHLENEGLVLVTGDLSVGKTILLKSILGEYKPPVRGSIMVDGKMSYASQEPWLFPSTIKQNIIFGEEFNQKRYEEVLDICNLQHDINRFEKKDENILTDRGVNLSKGQQARISLARALYRKADIYLIDDCFSSLDSKVGIEVFRKTVDFLKNKIVLLVTQNPMHFNYMQKKVLLIKNGTTQLLNKYEVLEEISEYSNYLKQIINISDTQQVQVFTNFEANKEVHDSEEDHQLLNKIHKNNIYHEDIDKGSTSLKTFGNYFKQCGGIYTFFISMAFFISFTISDVLSYKYVAIWINQEERVLNYKMQNKSLISQPDQEYLDLLWNKKTSFIIYNIVFALSILFGLLRTFYHFYISSKASIRIHKKMIESVMKAQLTFFDSNLLGNIINRFSKDVFNLDENVPNFFFQVFTMMLDLFFLFILIASMGWFFTILTILIFTAVMALLKYIYVPITSSAKRLESAVHSSMVGYLNSSLEGLETIRVHENEDLLKSEFDRHQDKYSSAYFIIIGLARASGTTMDLLSYIFMGSTYLYFFLKEDITAADVGLILSTFARMFLQVTLANRQTVELLAFMTSVERSINYTKINSESDKGLELKDWPKNGTIRYSNVSLKYPSNQLQALNEVNIEVKAKEKIAIVGRTGSGKSSLVSSIFNLYNFKGRILIDEVDIKYLSLNYRSKIGIIPQEPVIFSTNLRENLDPYRQFSDEQLWKALKKVKFNAKSLYEDIKSLKLSTGEKQLISLVRILLEEKKIVILDEATSNMNLETEKFICMILKDNLKDCTVLTIAHKFETFKDADRVLVLHNGQLSAFGNIKSID